MKQIIKYVAGGIVLLFVAGLIFSPSFRMEMKLIWTAMVGNAVDKLEAQLDQGELALAKYDQAYALQKSKLQKLIGVKKDAELAEKKELEKADDYRKKGKEDLALRCENSAKDWKARYDQADETAKKMEPKLQEVETLRERAYEDVRIARQHIATLKAMSDAMDDEEVQKLMDEAEQNVTNLQSHCNSLEAQIEVLQLTD
jgi:hypothetical protein